VAKKAVQVIEIERAGAVPELDPASAQAVASLRNHPGMQYLLAKLSAQRAALREALVKNRHADLKDVEFLQSGANWAAWFQQQIETAIGILNRPQPREAFPYEQEAFEQLQRRIDVIGGGSQVTTPGRKSPTRAESSE